MSPNSVEKLNSPQKESVTYCDGCLLVLSGAGSGKTRVITHRIAYLIQELKIDPCRILALTFTNKAANEMKERVTHLIGTISSGIMIRTFHSFCNFLLRQEADHIGFTKEFSIYDEADKKLLIKESLSDLNLSTSYFPLDFIIDIISKTKNNMTSPQEIVNPNHPVKRYISSIYDLYQKKLLDNNAMDFDDLLVCVIKLFSENPEILKKYKNRFRYIMVDEYQDTNWIQHRLLKYLCSDDGNIMVVGDDDQAIYAWRGATIENILSFEKEFPSVRTIKLEQNYRSQQNILKAANALIKHNRNYRGKKLWSNIKDGEKVTLYKAYDERDEATFIANTIKYLIDSEGYNFEDFGALFRMKAQSRIIEESFLKQDIPYVLIGGTGFYQRREIKDIVAYLRVISNPMDTVSLARIINVPRRGIGKKSFELFCDILKTHNINIYQFLELDLQKEEKQKLPKTLFSFLKSIQKLYGAKDKLSIKKLLERLVEEIAYIDYLIQLEEESETRIENVNELFSLALEYEREETQPSLEGFLTKISLFSDIDQSEDKGAVKLLTLHSAKGLEFPVVFLTGLEENILPHRRCEDKLEEIEEERRLCYVGITRAKDILYLTATTFRLLFGYTTSNPTSRFIRELGEQIKSYR